jgi:hypothetical protein
MRHHRGFILALLAAGLLVASGRLAAADDAAAIADQLNARWAPNPPAFSPEGVAQQRGPDKFGEWGGVRIGNIIAIDVAKSMLAAPNNQKTPAQALRDAQQAVMAERQGPGPKGWGRITQDLTGQKLGALMNGAQPPGAAKTGQAPSADKSAKGGPRSADKATGKTDQAFSNAFDAQASHAAHASVAVSGPGAGVAGRGQGKDVGTQGVGDAGGQGAGAGRGGGEGHGGGNGGGGGEGGGGGKGK